MTTWKQSTLGFALCKVGKPEVYGSQSICLVGLSNSRTACIVNTMQALGAEHYEKLIAEGYKVLPVKVTIDND